MRKLFGPARLWAFGSVAWGLGDICTSFFGRGRFKTIDLQIHDTYFVIAHVHFMLWMTFFFGLMSVIYSFYQPLTGRPLNKVLGYLHFWVTMIVTYLALGAEWIPYISPMEVLPMGYVRYSSWKNGFGSPLFIWNWVYGVILLLLLAVQVLFVFNLLFSLFRRRRSLGETVP